MKSMSLDEFMSHCVAKDKNVVKDWNYWAFTINCVKCGSVKCYAVNELSFREGTGDGCETCGWGADVGEVLGHITIKCSDCGNAMTVITAKDVRRDY